MNVTGPTPVTNAEFTKTLGRVVHRPTAIPTPLLPLKARYGSELVQHLLVEGQRVLPKRLDEPASVRAPDARGGAACGFGSTPTSARILMTPSRCLRSGAS